MRGRLVPAALSLLGAGAVAALVATRAGKVGDALTTLPWPVLAIVALLHASSLVCRSEAWGVTMAATRGYGMPRRAVHTANSAAFVAGSLQSTLAMPVRVALMRRFAPAAAPRAAQIAVADVPIFLLEVAASGAVLVAAAFLGATSPWEAVVVVIVGAAGLFAARRAADRFAHRPMAAGLAVLRDERRRGRLVFLIAAVTVLAVVRLSLLLHAAHMPHGPGSIAALMCAGGLLGLLPLGASAPSAAAAATVGTAGGLAGALAVGLAIAATSLAGVLLYGIAVVMWNTLGARRVRPVIGLRLLDRSVRASA